MGELLTRRVIQQREYEFQRREWDGNLNVIVIFIFREIIISALLEANGIMLFLVLCSSYLAYGCAVKLAVASLVAGICDILIWCPGKCHGGGYCYRGL